MSKNSITKSNALIEAGYRLSLTEMQVVLYGISLINPLQKKFPLIYQIEIKRFAEMFNRDHGQIYKEIKDAILKRFWERDFSYRNQAGEIVTNRWLTQVVHKDKTGFIQIKFSEEVQPYLHQLQKQFTTYYIDKIAKFKSIYSIRIYEYAIMNLNKLRKSKCQFPLSVEEIKERLEIGEKYKRFSNLKAFVLEPAKKEINKHSDINLTYKVIKLGRSPHKIEFTVTKKSDIPTLRSIKPSSDHLSPAIMEKAHKIAYKAGWDIYAIREEFYAYMRKKGKPDNLEGAFIGFVKKKLSQPH